ncbi:hypothetical protein GcM1_161009, partial [Golovinomyces cichoracearum]
AGSERHRKEAILRDLFVDQKATAAILELLNNTGMGKKHNENKEKRRENDRRENNGITELDDSEE